MTEIVIKSARDNGRLITIANIHDGIAIFTGMLNKHRTGVSA